MLLRIEELEYFLDQLQQWDAIELRISENSTRVRIPYLMNDAVECFLEFPSCRVQGTWVEDWKDSVTYDVLEDAGSFGIIFYQGEVNMLSLWFEEADLHIFSYRYHRIGHRWRSQPGEDRLRRIVNLLCVIHDKRTFLGGYACSEEEEYLASLIEFAPLCFYTPIDESIEDWYPETDEGMDAMLSLCEMIGDSSYADLIEVYADAEDEQREELRQQLISGLASSEHAMILMMIEHMVEEASNRWPERDYGSQEMAHIQGLRRDREEEWHNRGYQGSYPLLTRQSEAGELEVVEFFEEHPYEHGDLEFDSYHFRIHEIESKGEQWIVPCGKTN